MEYVNGVIKLRNVDHSILALMVNPNLANTAANSWHRLPVAGLQAKLHTIQLVAGISSWCSRKGPYVLERRANEIEWLQYLKYIELVINYQEIYIKP